MQILVDLEPIKLDLVPELLTLLIHDVRDARIAVFFLLDILLLLFLVVVVRLLAFPQIIDFFDFDAACDLRCRAHEVRDFFLQLRLLLPLPIVLLH